MLKKTLIFIFILLCICFISACGIDKSMIHTPEPEPSDEIVESVDEITQEALTATEKPVGLPVPSLEQVTAEVLEMIEEEDYVVADGIEEEIKKEYESGHQHANTVFSALLDKGVIAYPEEEEEGIMICTVNYHGDYTWPDTGLHKCKAFTVELALVDPDTGENTSLRTFSSEETHSCSAALYSIGGNTMEARSSFSEDYSKMTATLDLSDGSKSVGWIDEDGEYTDVSSMVTKKSDFGSKMKHSNPKFWGNYLYFLDDHNGIRGRQIKRVPIDDISADTVEIVLDNFAMSDVYVFPDGSVDKVGWGRNIYNEDMTHKANSEMFTDWINKSSYLGQDRGMIYRFKSDNSRTNYSDQKELVPYVKDRWNYSPVCSPDGKKAVFISYLTNGILDIFR